MSNSRTADHGGGGAAVAGGEGPVGDDSVFDTEVKSEPNADGDDQNPGFMCNQCHELIVKFRYVCVQCADYDLCDACEAKMEHAHHYMLRVPRGKEQSEVSSVLGSVRLAISSAISGEAPVHAVFSTQTETEKDAEVKEEEPDDDVQEADPLLPIVPSVGDNEQSQMEVWTHKSVYPVIPSSSNTSVAQEVPNLNESALLAQAVASISGTTKEQSPQLQFIVTPFQGGVFQLQTTMTAPEMPVKRKPDTDIYASTSTTATHMAIKRKPVVRQEPVLRREPIVRLEPLTETQIKTSQRNIVKQQTLTSTSTLSASERPKIGFVKSGGGTLRLVKFGATKSKTENVGEKSETVKDRNN